MGYQSPHGHGPKLPEPQMKYITIKSFFLQRFYQLECKEIVALPHHRIWQGFLFLVIKAFTPMPPFVTLATLPHPST